MKDSLNIGHPIEKPSCYWPQSAGLPYIDDLQRSFLNLTAIGSDGTLTDETGLLDAKCKDMPCGSYISASASNIATPVNLSGKTKVTIAAWFYRDSILKTCQISQSDSADNRITLLWHSTNFIYVICGSGGSTFGMAANTAVGWSYCELIYDGTQATNEEKLKLRINNVPVLLGFTGIIPSSVAVLTNFLKLGKEDAPARLSDGKIHSVGIWENVKSYAETIARDSNDLVAYYPDHTGFDVSGNGNHGTPSNVTLSFAAVNLYNLRYGYQNFNTAADGTGTALQVPYKLDQSKIYDIAIGASQLINAVTYYLISEHPAGNYHNLADGYIDFANGESEADIWFKIFDKSDVGIYSESYEGSTIRDLLYYDSTNPYKWHISELSIGYMNQYLNDNYKKLAYMFFNVDVNDKFINLKKLMLFGTQKTAIQNARILRWGGDYE